MSGWEWSDWMVFAASLAMFATWITLDAIRAWKRGFGGGRDGKA